MKCVVPQIYKPIKLAFYNIINRNQRLWINPETKLIQLLCTTSKNLMPRKIPCRQRLPLLRLVEHLSGMPRPLVTYDDGGSALWTKRLDFRKPINVTRCAEIRFAPSASFLWTSLQLQKFIVLLCKHSCKQFPGNNIPQFPCFSWPDSLINVCSKKTFHWFKYFSLM